MVNWFLSFAKCPREIFQSDFSDDRNSSLIDVCDMERFFYVFNGILSLLVTSIELKILEYHWSGDKKIKQDNIAGHC